MNPGEPAPTALQRWVSRRRTGVRAGAIVLMAVSVLFGVYVLATEGLNGSIGGAVGGVGGSISVLISTVFVPRYVENWDNKNGSTRPE